MEASATFALKAGVWFRRGRLVMVSPDSLGTACPLSGRNSTYRPVQISETSSAVSLAHLRRLIDQGDGPRVTRLGARAVRVRTADAIDWLDRLGLKMPKS